MNNFLEQSQLINELLNNYKLSEIKKEYKVISSKYREEKINSSSVVVSDKQALSYITSRMGETSVVVDDVLGRLNRIIDLEHEIKTVLDIGSGTGSVFWALENYVENAQITAVEKSESMIKYSKLLSNNLSSKISYIKDDILALNPQNINCFDLTIESFVLNEMTDADRKKTLDIMMSQSGKYIILIEPGTPKSYERMMKDREYLLSKGLRLVLPCPHEQKCSLVDDYCNFSVRVNRTRVSRLIKDASLNYEDEKYFYLIFCKTEVPKLNNSIILRNPIYKKNNICLKTCNSACVIKDVVITKNNKKNYLKAKKAKHGDIVSFLD